MERGRFGATMCLEFPDPGTFTFSCTVHKFAGTVIVTDGATVPESPGAALVCPSSATGGNAFETYGAAAFALGDDPDTRLKYGPAADGTYARYFFKDGFDLEVEHPIGRVSVIGRFDGLRRRETSVERYQFNNFPDETAIHLGVAGQL